MNSPNRREWSDLFTLSIHYPKIAALITIATFIFSITILPKGKVDFSLEELYPQDSPIAEFNKDHRESFGRDDDLIFAIRVGDPFHPDVLHVETQASQMAGVQDTLSPHSFRMLKKDEQGVLQQSLLDPTQPNPLYTGTLIAQNGQAGSVLIRLSPEVNRHDLRVKIIEDLEAELATLEGTWHLGGVPMIRTSYVRLMISDLLVLIPLATIVSAFFFVLSFRDFRHVFSCVFTIVLGALLATAVYITTGAAFNVFAPAFIAVTLVVGTSDLIHLVHRFTDHHKRLKDPKLAAISAAKEVGTACTLTSFTTAVGFFALLATDIPPIRIFGLATGIGVIGTFFVAFLIMPPLLVWLGPPSSKAKRHGKNRTMQLRKLGNWSLKHRQKLMWGWIFTSLGLGFLTMQLRVDHQIFEDIDAIESVANTQDFMEEQMGAILPLQIDLTFDEDVRNEESLQAIDELAQWLRSQPQMGHVISLADILRLGWQTLNDPTANLPPDKESVAQLLLFMSIGGENPARSVLVVDEGPNQYKRTRISARMKDAGHASTMDMVTRLREFMAQTLPKVNAKGDVTGVAWMAQEVNSTLTRQFASSFAIALSLIGIVWLLITRSIRRSLLALVPNLMPLLILLALMGGAGLGLKPSTAMVLSVGLGIAVDDTVHFLAVYVNNKRHGKTKAIITAYETAGRSIVDTTLCLGLGFLLFAFSEFGASFNFGMLTGFTIFAALIADLFLLGPLLAIWD